jgi:hypothetical protein
MNPKKSKEKERRRARKGVQLLLGWDFHPPCDRLERRWKTDTVLPQKELHHVQPSLACHRE